MTAFSAPAAESRYADCARALGAAADGDSDALAADRLVEALRSLCQDLDVATPQAHGIDKDEWFRLSPLMAEQALASGSPADNPVVPRGRDPGSLRADLRLTPGERGRGT
ncbi:dehydroquinate synthase/iron-containing alcohol dehydrogenase family protein [Streptomyces canus]|uniref:iron-containing alcohol dehydrogenase n=1 Tax=Streptomyces canus TaxID=58343 RepID=UPI0021F1D63D|nr:iron-containing alcohol dehydrogenase [Streptomyces canus]